MLQKSSDDDEMDFNMKSKESSKEDDIQAICEMRGAGCNAPLALQLKAIDEEYHYLLDQGQSDRADYVQKLYAWKSKQGTKVRNADKCSVGMIKQSFKGVNICFGVCVQSSKANVVLESE